MHNPDWFETWFDSPYYHILYKNRDEQEAQSFIDNLISFLKPQVGALMLDNACGKGRHAIYLHQKGFAVTGLDLSPQSIEAANTFASENLTFAVHDMRNLYKAEHFDCILNIFTSFGYFEDEADDRRVLQSVYDGLKPNGYFVFDYLNALPIYAALPTNGCQLSKTIEGIHFDIQKNIVGRHIVKHIHFSDGGKEYQFTERVKLFKLQEILDLIPPHLTLQASFGSYQLSPYEAQTSERMILVFKKKE
jgi:SAM-dependent methyltransferase